jgi:hypothetical protein
MSDSLPPEDIIARAQAAKARKDEEERQEVLEAEERHQREEGCYALSRALSALWKAKDDHWWAKTPYNLADYLPAITETFLQVCRVLMDQRDLWRRFDHATIKAQLRERNADPDQSDAAYDWARYLINKGLDGQPCTDDIARAATDSALRGALTWTEKLLRGLVGLLRVELLPEVPPEAPQPPVAPTTPEEADFLTLPFFLAASDVPDLGTYETPHDFWRWCRRLYEDLNKFRVRLALPGGGHVAPCEFTILPEIARQCRMGMRQFGATEVPEKPAFAGIVDGDRSALDRFMAWADSPSGQGKGGLQLIGEVQELLTSAMAWCSTHFPRPASSAAATVPPDTAGDETTNQTYELLQVDTREAPLVAPAGTPSPLREAFDAVAAALFEAAEMRRCPPSGWPMFEDQARALAAAREIAGGRYAAAELLLQAAADENGRCSHQEALSATARINDACGHVMLRLVPPHEAAAHIRAVPAFNLAEMLRAMRRQTARAALPLQARAHQQTAPNDTKRGPAAGQIPPGLGAQDGHQPRPDGVEGGCWLWWKGKRHDIPKGNVFKLLAFMWDRDSASYDALVGPVFDDPVEPQTLRSLANKANNAIAGIGLPWKFSTNSVSRLMTKKTAG